jgi:hypothetical protein
MVYGPFEDDDKAQEWVKKHVEENRAASYPLCENGLFFEDHEIVEPMST